MDATGRTNNPAAFEEAVRAYLEPTRHQFNHQQMLETFLSVDRFRVWAAVVERNVGVAGKRVLSSGCGFAGSLLAWREAGAPVALGVEVDPDYLRFGALRTAELPGAGVVAYDGVRLPFGDAAFELVESMDVLEHTPDARTYLGELHRVLAPGGAVLLATPNRLWPVEQHLGILGPPWLPIGMADAAFGAVARLPNAVPALSEERRFKYSKLRGMRTSNVSLRSLRGHAKHLGFHLQLLDPADYGDAWPLPRTGARTQQLSRHRIGKFLAPSKTLAVLLHKR